MPKFPDVTVKLTEIDGNALAILGKVSRALNAAGHTDAAKEYQKNATAGDYNHLLVTTTKYVNVE